jgi:hypothetical protein
MRESASVRCSLVVRNRAVEIRNEERGSANVSLRGARVYAVHRGTDGRFAFSAHGCHNEGGTISFCIVPANGNVWWVFEFDLEDQYDNWISIIREEGAIMFDFSKRLELTHQIGCGAQSRVFEAIERATATVVAVKVAMEGDMQSLLREVDFLHTLRGDEGVIMHHGVYEFRVQGSPTLGLVLERFDGTLKEVLRQDAPFSEDEIRPLVLQLVRGVAAVHHKGMVHRDIKPGNIFVRRGPGRRVAEAVLADFGLAAWTNDAKQMGVRCGSVGFCAPEMLQLKGQVSGKSDMFSVGIVVMFLLTGQHPFGSDPEKWYRKNERGKVDMPTSISRSCLQLLEGLVAIDPAERWTADDALRCPWLSVEPSFEVELSTQLQHAVAPPTPSLPTQAHVRADACVPPVVGRHGPLRAHARQPGLRRARVGEGAGRAPDEALQSDPVPAVPRVLAGDCVVPCSLSLRGGLRPWWPRWHRGQGDLEASA